AGEPAVADLTSLWRADKPCLANAVRREIVVEHERLAALALERVDDLCVAATSACVSPRVNTAEPWVRGSTPTCTSILRTVRVSRPSMRGLPAMMRLRTTLFSASW